MSVSAVPKAKVADPQEPPEEEESRGTDFDSWYSAIISFVFHFCVLTILPLLASVTTTRDTLPPDMGVVEVAETTSDSGAAGDALPFAESPEMSEAAAPELTPPSELPPTEELQSVTPVDIPQSVEPSDAVAQQQIRDKVAQGQQAAASAKAAVQQAMADNLNKGSGTGTPGGGGGGEGRAGRAARWILQFRPRGPQDHLQQLGGLGAEIAFPQRGDKYQFFTNLASSPTSSIRDLSNESRIYWIDENPNSFLPVARHLGVTAAPMMIAFLPTSLEDRMLKLELAYQGASSEDDIQQTVFECVARGGSYDVIVVKQTLR